MESVRDLLADVPMFGGLDCGSLDLIAGCGTNRSFRDGEYLMREGDDANTFFAIRAGAVALETYAPSQGALVIETIHAPDVVGWSWLVAPYRSAFDVRAVGTARTTAFDGACLRGKLEHDHALGFELYRRFTPIIVERLQATRLRLLDVYGHVAAP